MPQVSVVSGQIQFTKTATPDGGSAQAQQVLSMLENVTSGTANGQADLGFVDIARALGSGSSENFDFTGSLTDALGIAIASVEVVALAIRNPVANTVNLTIGNAATNGCALFQSAVANTMVLKPGDWFVSYSYSGWAIVAGTGDLLKILAGAAAMTYDIGFLARSA